jgi:aspartyl protease family protein
MRIAGYFLLLLLFDCGLSGCAGCSYQQQDAFLTLSDTVRDTPVHDELPDATRKVVVQMKKEDGIYKVPVVINGTEMDFYFDTGAGMISMSQVEAAFLLKNGKLNGNDVLGTQSYSTADGSVGRSSIINLKDVSIGGRTIHNVEASIVDNADAPLLLGQSLLSRFGKISIDYEKSQITLE